MLSIHPQNFENDVISGDISSAHSYSIWGDIMEMCLSFWKQEHVVTCSSLVLPSLMSWYLVSSSSLFSSLVVSQSLLSESWIIKYVTMDIQTYNSVYVMTQQGCWDIYIRYKCRFQIGRPVSKSVQTFLNIKQILTSVEVNIKKSLRGKVDIDIFISTSPCKISLHIHRDIFFLNLQL